MHPDRRARTAQLDDLATQGEWERYYQQLMLWEFPREARMGWQLAFLRPFAVPRMAEILVEAGHLIHNPLKRAYDTGLIIYEIVHDGIDGPRGRKMISVMNRAHHGRDIEPEDMTYVLTAFIVAPIRYIERTGWRSITDNDRRASHEFYSRMGQLMNIKDIPDSYTASAQLFDQYEKQMVAPSPAGSVLGSNLIAVLKDRLPGPAEPIAELVFTTLLDDRAIAAALDLRPPPRILNGLATIACRSYGAIQSRRAPRVRPIFTPGTRAGKQYPEGYSLDDLGPDSVTH